MKKGNEKTSLDAAIEIHKELEARDKARLKRNFFIPERKTVPYNNGYFIQTVKRSIDVTPVNTYVQPKPIEAIENLKKVFKF
jgi:hypothetical protein